jgi:hypothetical protein
VGYLRRSTSLAALASSTVLEILDDLWGFQWTGCPKSKPFWVHGFETVSYQIIDFNRFVYYYIGFD